MRMHLDALHRMLQVLVTRSNSGVLLSVLCTAQLLAVAVPPCRGPRHVVVHHRLRYSSMGWDRKKALASGVLFVAAISCIYSTVGVAGTQYAPWSLWLAAIGLGCGYLSAQLLTQAVESPQAPQKVLKKAD